MYCSVLAVVLWAAATMLELLLRDPPPPPPAVVEEEPAATPVPPPAAPVDCGLSEQRLVETLADSRSCSTDDDCTLFDYGYPIDCMTSVSRTAIPRLRQEFRGYDASCPHRVFFDCPTDPYVRLPVCRDNRCIVELHNSDTLQERTMETLRQGSPR